MNLLGTLENGLFALAQVLRFPVIVLLWVSVAAAVFMAEAYAQLTGEVAVAMVTAGPGMANAIGVATLLAFGGTAGVIAVQLEVPVVPVRLRGLDTVWREGQRMARPGRVEVRFGPHLRLRGGDYVALAAQLEAAVKAL